jgi:hypothetical protein
MVALTEEDGGGGVHSHAPDVVTVHQSAEVDSRRG